MSKSLEWEKRVYTSGRAQLHPCLCVVLTPHRGDVGGVRDRYRASGVTSTGMLPLRRSKRQKEEEEEEAEVVRRGV